MSSVLSRTTTRGSFRFIKGFYLGLFVMVLVYGKCGPSSYLNAQSWTYNSEVTTRGSLLSFEPNLGQDRSTVRYIAHAPGYQLKLEESEAVIQMDSRRGAETKGGADRGALRIRFAGASRQVRVEPAEMLAATHNYLPSGEPSTWISGIPTYGRVNYSGLYPGIGLSFYGKGKSVEYDFLVQAGSDPGSIQLSFDGAERATVDRHGNLSLTVHGDIFRLLKPVAYQPSFDGSNRSPVEVQYKLNQSRLRSGGGTTLSFHPGKYDHRKPLIIDPVLVYGLYIPGVSGSAYPPYYFSDTVINNIAADAQGNSYVVAEVQSTNASFSVLKFDPTGRLVWNASLGATTISASATAIAVSAAGEVYVTGTAAPNFPTTTNAFQSVCTGNSCGYVAVIAANGASLEYASYLGGNGTTAIISAAVDSLGKLYVAGSTNSSNFPTTAGVYQREGGSNGQYSNFAAKIDPALSPTASLVYSTYLGSSNGYNYSSPRLAIDSSGNAYIATNASNGYPVTNGAYQYDGISAGGVYLTKLSANASSLVYSAYLGPGTPEGIAVDGSGDAYVTGMVTSADFPTTAGAYQTTYPGGFALELSSDGTSLVYSTFLSGPSGYASGSVTPTGLAIQPGCKSACAVTIAGTTTTTDFPLIKPIQSFFGNFPPYSNGVANSSTGFLVKLAPNGTSTNYSTYLGASTSTTTSSGGIAEDSAGNVYFASNISGIDAPVTVPNVPYPGEGFLTKISSAAASSVVAVPNQIVFSSAQAVHTTSTMTSAVEVRNMGSAAATLTKPFTSSSSDFSETDNCPASLPAGGMCNVNLNFTPAAAGARSGTLKVASGAANSPALVSMSGTGIDSFNLVASPISLAFGDSALNAATAAKVLTMRNTGDQPVGIVAISTTLPDYVETSNCPAQLNAGASCQLSVTFKPTQIGLRGGYVLIQLPGFNYYNGYAYPNEFSLPVSGTGVTATAGTGTLNFSESGVNFGNVVLGGASVSETVVLLNPSDAPVTVNSISVTISAGKGKAGDFTLVAPATIGYLCGYSYNGPAYTVPFQIGPQRSCVIGLQFTPSMAGQEAGTLSLSDSATSSPHSVGLSGIGLAAVQALTINPTKMAYPAQPLHVASAPQTFNVTNSGDAPVVIDRAVTAGDFVIDDQSNSNCEAAVLQPQASCALGVAFLPTAVGARTGMLSMRDTVSGTPQVFNLAGAGIIATGALIAGQTSVTFPRQAQGTTSSQQELIFSNPGNSTVTINSIIASGDFAVVIPPSYSSPQGCAVTVGPASTCQVGVVYSPTVSSGPETGTLTAHSTAGDIKVQLAGTAFSGAQSLGVAPATANFGSALAGLTYSSQGQINVSVVNTGAEPVTFPTPPVMGNTALGFSVSSSACGNYIPFSPSSTGQIPMPPGTSCDMTVSFLPSTAGAATTTLKLADSAGTQSITLTGVGVTKLPAVTVQPGTLEFDPLPPGSASNQFDYTHEVYVYNDGTLPVVISSVAVTAGSSDFVVNSSFSGCTGVTVAAGSYCTTVFQFKPSTTGYRTGTATFKDSKGNTYTATLVGYSVPPVDSVSLTPQALVLPATPVLSTTNTTGSAAYSVSLVNMGNRQFIVGAASSVNVSSTADFNAGYPGVQGCNAVVVPAGNACSVSMMFTPRSTGNKTGSITFPVTYADNKTTSVTATLSGTGVTPSNSATLLPQAVYFPSVAALPGNTNYGTQMIVTLTNTGNEPLTTGTVTGQNLTTTAGTGGDFVIPTTYCYQPLFPGSSCNFGVTFSPLATGTRTGSIKIPVTYAGGGTAAFTSTLTGTGTAPAPALVVTPAGLNFNVEVAGTADPNNVQNVFLASTGNVPVKILSVTASPNFTVPSNPCNGAVQNQVNCSITVGFAPTASAAPGVATGTLTIVDNALGSPHIVKLAGTVVPLANELQLSQASAAFGTQSVGTASAPQVIYLTNLNSSSVLVKSISLGGTNASDFTESEACGGSLGFALAGRASCTITVGFSPGKTSVGARTATVTITPASGPVLTIQLTGTGH